MHVHRAPMELPGGTHARRPSVQADGSALYSLQALWTQAREQLHVITIVCSNRAYAILQACPSMNSHPCDSTLAVVRSAAA